MKAHKKESEDFNHIRQWLLPKLEARGESVEQFAGRCDLTRSSIYYYLTDASRPSEQVMARMCHALGVPFEEGLAQYTPKRMGRPPVKG